MLWSEFDVLLTHLTADSGAEIFSAPLRMAMYNQAQRFFAQTHTAPLVSATADGAVLSAPSDLIQIAGILNQDNEWLTVNQIVPGGQFPTEGFLDTAYGYRICEADATDLVIWYWAQYRDIATATDALPIPSFAVAPLSFLTVAFMLTGDMTNMALLRQWQSRIQAGTPEMNPPRSQAEWYLRQYQTLVASVPPQVRTMFHARR